MSESNKSSSSGNEDLSFTIEEMQKHIKKLGPAIEDYREHQRQLNLTFEKADLTVKEKEDIDAKMLDIAAKGGIDPSKLLKLVGAVVEKSKDPKFVLESMPDLAMSLLGTGADSDILGGSFADLHKLGLTTAQITNALGVASGAFGEITGSSKKSAELFNRFTSALADPGKVNQLKGMGIKGLDEKNLDPLRVLAEMLRAAADGKQDALAPIVGAEFADVAGKMSPEGLNKPSRLPNNAHEATRNFTSQINKLQAQRLQLVAADIKGDPGTPFQMDFLDLKMKAYESLRGKNDPLPSYYNFLNNDLGGYAASALDAKFTKANSAFTILNSIKVIALNEANDELTPRQKSIERHRAIMGSVGGIGLSLLGGGFWSRFGLDQVGTYVGGNIGAGIGVLAYDMGEYGGLPYPTNPLMDESQYLAFGDKMYTWEEDMKKMGDDARAARAALDARLALRPSSFPSAFNPTNNDKLPNCHADPSQEKDTAPVSPPPSQSPFIVNPYRQDELIKSDPLYGREKRPGYPKHDPDKKDLNNWLKNDLEKRQLGAPDASQGRPGAFMGDYPNFGNGQEAASWLSNLLSGGGIQPGQSVPVQSPEPKVTLRIEGRGTARIAKSNNCNVDLLSS